jgi:alpha-L-rhamnosidase
VLAGEMAAQYERVRAHFQEVYWDGAGKMTQTSQTAYLMALKFGLLPESYRDEALAILKQKIVDNDYTLSCGFVGTSTLNQTLSELGESNLAYSLLLQRKDPSWLYSVDQGATTIWERWNSYTKERGFGDVGMNSFNHYAYGAVAEWMYRYMLGIDTCEDGFGFKHILLQPKPDLRTPSEMPAGQEKVTWVRGYYDSVSGKIEADWKLENGVFEYNVVVPAGVKATLHLPIGEGEATYVVDGSACAAAGERKDGCLVIDVAAGEHTFESSV